MRNGVSQSRHRQSSVLVCAVLALFLFASPTIAEDHSGSTGTATWTVANSPHIIIGEVTVGNGDTLTIEPGCEIKFDGDYRLQVQGALIADGEPADHITFTSNQPSPNPGDWQYLYFYLADAGCLLDYCDISYGGSSYGNIYVRSSAGNVTISNCTIEQSDSSGVYVYGATPTISGSTIRDNDYAGIQCHDTSSDPLVSDCTIQGNGDYAIRTYGGNVTDLSGTMTFTGNGYDAILVGADGSTIGTWLDLDVPLVIGGELTVTGDDTLTIKPGCTLKFDGDYRLYILGTLIADGTPIDHITFTSNQASPSPGDWQYLYFYLADAGCLLDYCDISYGGSVDGSVYVRSSGSNVTVSNCTIEQSGNNGIYISSTDSDPSIFDCTIQNNLGYAIRTFGRLVDSITGTMTITGNTYDAILVEPDGSTTGTWLDHDVPYAIGGELTVPNGGTLFLSPGCTLKFNGNDRLYVAGTLIADGEPADHIVFTSNQPSPSPGDWQFVYFYLADAGCLLDYCDISYGGSSYGNIYVRSSAGNVTISNCTIEQSDSSGVYVNGATPTISGSTIRDNDYAGIQCHDTSSDPLVSDCTIQGNGDYAIRTYGGNVTDLSGTMTFTGNGYDAILVGADGSTIGTWLDLDVPLVIGGELTVTGDDTLTIKPGCTLKFDGDYRLYILGTLIADGTPIDHITFTSNQASPSPGDWQYLYFYLADAGCLLDYCDISYGGSVDGSVYVRSSGSNVTVSNCTIEQSGNNGIYISSTDSDPSIFDCTIQNNLGYAIRTFGRLVDSITGTMTITGNTYDAILVEPDGSTTGTWLDHDVPYAIGGELTVPNGGTLFLSPGCTLKFNGNDRLYVAGTLIADGEPADHIVFTSNQPSPSPGDWQFVYFYLADAGCLLDYCDISYGGSSYGNIYVRSSAGNVTISNCTIEQSDSSGVYVYGATPTISGSTIRDNDYAGIQCHDTSSDPLVSDCTIQDNGDYAIRTYGGNVTDLSGTMTFTGNGYDAILVGADGSTIGTWLDLDVPLVIGGDLTVTNGDTLTINPGCTLKFDGEYRLYIQGTLIADGEPADHITFTSNQASPSPGAWRNLCFYLADAGCLLDYCDISYGGSSDGSVYVRSSGSNVAISNCVVDTSATAGVYVYGGSAPTITDCLMRGSSGAGIHCVYGDANPVIDSCVLQGNLYGYQGSAGSPHFAYNNQIINNTSYGFYITGSSAPTFGSDLSEWNDIYGNGTYEFYNGTSDVYAYYVYWGATDPSVIASRIFDENDDAALGIVHFTHWLNETHDSENTLSPPVINTITSTSDSVHITWSPVPGASSYKMYSSDKPYSGFQQDLTGLFNGLNWAAEITDVMKFFHVTAAAEPEESGSSNTVGFERYEADAVAGISPPIPSTNGR